MGNPEQHTQSSSKRRVLIVTACIAAATFALLICAEIFLPQQTAFVFWSRVWPFKHNGIHGASGAGACRMGLFHLRTLP